MEMKKTMNDQEKPQFGGTLNVIFHGSMTIYDNQKDEYPIQALLPKNAPKNGGSARSDRHVYRAGNWLGETELSDGNYKLLGVNGGGAHFDRKTNLILQSESAVPAQAHATVSFPRPQAITSLRAANVPFDSFNQDDAKSLKLDQKGVHLAALHVFTYTFDDDNDLRLASADNKDDGHYWEPAFSGNYINLHIFCSEDRFSTPSQASADFAACTALLGLKLELERPQPIAAAPDDLHLPAGVIGEETEDLPFRTLRMARLGRLVKQNGDANLAWASNDALDCPEACMPLLGCNLIEVKR
jgi:hypothetical protein